MELAIHTPYRHVQGLSRGLSILQALNDSGIGGATPRDISAATKINRTTVKRILETLVEDGYVLPCDGDGGYGLAPQVRSLSRGLSSEARVLQCACPVLKAMGDETGWSMRLTLLEDGAMIVRDSTHGRSRIAAEFTVGVRHRLPILLTAAGRAYFVQCEPTERQRILQLLRTRKDEQSALASNDRLIELLTRRVLDDGYGANDGDWGGRCTGALALPVCTREGRPLACLSVVYDRKSVGQSAPRDEFLPELRRGVARIEEALRSH